MRKYFELGRGYHHKKTGNFYVYMGRDPDNDSMFVSSFRSDVLLLSDKKAHRTFDMNEKYSEYIRDEFEQSIYTLVIDNLYKWKIDPAADLPLAIIEDTPEGLRVIETSNKRTKELKTRAQMIVNAHNASLREVR